MSAQLQQLRNVAREIFAAAVKAVDVNQIIQRSVELQGDRLNIIDVHEHIGRPVYVVSIGKAGFAMAGALDKALGEHISGGIITAPEPAGEDACAPGTGAQTLSSKWEMFYGGHPLPNAASLKAARATFQLLEKADAENALLIFAVSGGGSAMIEWPVTPGISLEDLQEANRLLVYSGATIAEINVVRRALSAVKGGKLAARAPNAQIITLIISDTNPGDEASVASGPSLSPKLGTTNPTEVVAKYDLEAKLRPAIVKAIHQSTQQPEPLKIQAAHFVLADNRTAVDAATRHAKLLGFEPVIADQISEQPIAEGCEELLRQINSLPARSCLISGGEFSCPVRGEGRGGRNLETVLRCSMALTSHDQHIIVLSGGTDGIDGNSPAAGAIADETTLVRARSLGLDAMEFLMRSDSYEFFKQLDDVIITGPTGTNVRDIRLLIKSPKI